MTPSLSGRMASMLSGVRPIIRFASWPTARISPVRGVEGDDAGLVEHQALATHVDQRVGRAEIHGHVTADQAACHACCLVCRRTGEGWAERNRRTALDPLPRLSAQVSPDMTPRRTGREASGPHEPVTDQRSGNQIPISRAADSGESEPCTRFCWTATPQSRPRSPRMVPGAATRGVGGAGQRPEALDHALALDHDGRHGPGQHELDERPVERLALVLGVVLGQQLRRRLAQLEPRRACSPSPRCGAGPHR